MNNKAKLNYLVDIVIGAGFLLSAISGIALLFTGSGGYQGGRNPHYAQSVLFLTKAAWSDFHTWSSILMVLGVAGHFILHWNWMVKMTKSIFKKSKVKLNRQKEYEI